MKFNGRHIIITGGSSGIGKATAKLLASKGANMLDYCSRSQGLNIIVIKAFKKFLSRVSLENACKHRNN